MSFTFAHHYDLDFDRDAEDTPARSPLATAALVAWALPLLWIPLFLLGFFGFLLGVPDAAPVVFANFAVVMLFHGLAAVLSTVVTAGSLLHAIVSPTRMEEKLVWVAMAWFATPLFYLVYVPLRVYFRAPVKVELDVG